MYTFYDPVRRKTWNGNSIKAAHKKHVFNAEVHRLFLGSSPRGPSGWRCSGKAPDTAGISQPQTLSCHTLYAQSTSASLSAPSADHLGPALQASEVTAVKRPPARSCTSWTPSNWSLSRTHTNSDSISTRVAQHRNMPVKTSDWNNSLQM